MKNKSKSRIRIWIQIFFFILILMISINHTFQENGTGISYLSSASTHAICPFGGVVSIYQYVVSGTYVKKIHESSFILMWIVFFLALIAGPVFCGWICPFGTFQELLSKIGRKIFKKKFNRFIPYKYDKYFRFTRYIVLTMVIIQTVKFGILKFSDVDPYFALFNLWSDEVTLLSIIILIGIILLSFFIERPFCKYACPYGAVLGIFNFFRIFSIKRDDQKCINCKACDIACPMNIPVSSSDTIRNHQCISCMKCSSSQSCPVDDTVNLDSVYFLKNKFKIPEKIIGLIIFIVFIAGIGSTMVFNLWKTESGKEPAKYSEGEFSGLNNPADIRGSYSFLDVENAFDVKIDILAKAFGITNIENISDFKIKEFETIYKSTPEKELGTDSVRLFVALYKNLPFTPEDTTVLPAPAAAILKEKISEDEYIKLKEKIINLSDFKVQTSDVSIEEHNANENTDKTIKGTTTFNDLKTCGLNDQEIKKILGIEPGPSGTTIKDYCSQNGIEFSSVKEKFQTAVALK